MNLPTNGWTCHLLCNALLLGLMLLANGGELRLLLLTLLLPAKSWEKRVERRWLCRARGARQPQRVGQGRNGAQH